MQPTNIILITVDCLRPDHVGCYGYSRDTTPRLDNLASTGALFLEAVSNGGRTPDSFPSILTSQLPPIEIDEYTSVMQRSPTLAGLLKAAGYQTAAFHSNPYLSRFFHYDEGFDIFEDSLGILSGRRSRQTLKSVHLRNFSALSRIIINRLGLIFDRVLSSLGGQRDVIAEELTNRVVSWLDTCHSNSFLWLHYMDTHYPYLPPAEYARKFCNRRISRYRMATLYPKQVKSFRNAERLSPEEIDTLANLYDANIRYVDDNIGRLLDNLGSRLDNTIIIVTADHGEAFGEHNSLGHMTLYEELVRVPLIMVGPGIKAGTVVKEPVEFMDLAPTIAELVGIGSVRNFQGKSLIPVMRGGQRVAKGVISTRLIPESGKRLISYRTSEWKYIRTESLDEADTLLSEELYNLKSDPKESHNRHDSENEETKAFELEAVDRILEFKQLKMERKTADEKEGIRTRIRKLKDSAKI